MLRAASWLLRLTALALVAAAVVASTRREPPPPRRAVAFLIDASAGIPPDALAAEVQTVEREAAAVVAQGGEAAAWAYAADAVALPLPKIPMTRAPMPSWLEKLDRNGADVRRALDRARAALPSADLVLFTDGHGGALPDDVDVRPVRYEWKGDVMARGLDAPAVTELARPFDARLRVDSPSKGSATAVLTANDVEVARQSVELQEGPQIVVFKNVAARPKGLLVLRGFVNADGDPRPANNFAAACTSVLGPPRVLLLEGRPGDAAAIGGILKAQEMEIIVEPVARLGAYTDALADIDAIVLSTADPAALDEKSIERLDLAVRSGTGLFYHVRRQGERAAMPERLASLLPVTWRPAGGPPPKPPDHPAPPRPPPLRPVPRTVEAPPIAVLVLLDKSGSMSGENIALAKEACLAAAETLSESDAFGVIAFNNVPEWVVRFVAATDRRTIEDQMSRVVAGGSTDIFVAVEAGVESMARRPEGVRHIILLSDGLTPPASWEEILKRAVDEKITLTTVCVGMGWPPNVQLMNSLAARCGGRFVYSASFNTVPQIFTKEVRRLVTGAKPPEKSPPPEPPPPQPTPPDPAPPGPDAKPDDQPRPVVKRDPHEATKGVENFPPVTGLVGATAKPSAATALEAGADPLLVTGRWGLGKTAVWTSDLNDAWCAAWAGTPTASQVVSQLVRFLSSTSRESVPAVTIHGARFTVEGWNGAKAKLVAPVERELESSEVPIDRFDEPYRVMITRGDASLLIGLIRAYPDELGWRTHHEAMLKPRPTKPAPAPAPESRDLRPWLLVGAALAVIFDVALRRVSA